MPSMSMHLYVSFCCKSSFGSPVRQAGVFWPPCGRCEDGGSEREKVGSSKAPRRGQRCCSKQAHPPLPNPLSHTGRGVARWAMDLWGNSRKRSSGSPHSWHGKSLVPFQHPGQLRSPVLKASLPLPQATQNADSVPHCRTPSSWFQSWENCTE